MLSKSREGPRRERGRAEAVGCTLEVFRSKISSGWRCLGRTDEVTEEVFSAWRSREVLERWSDGATARRMCLRIVERDCAVGSVFVVGSSIAGSRNTLQPQCQRIDV